MSKVVEYQRLKESSTAHTVKEFKKQYREATNAGKEEEEVKQPSPGNKRD